MKQHASVKEIAQMHEDSKIQDGFRGRGRRMAAITKKFEFQNGTHLCQLKNGDKKSGDPVLMTGREMFKRNKRFEEQFWKALDTNEHARMSRWFIVKKFVSDSEAE